MTTWFRRADRCGAIAYRRVASYTPTGAATGSGAANRSARA